MRKTILTILSVLGLTQLFAQNPREHLLMDFGWKFEYGHAKNFEKDFYSGTSYFTYFAKTGYGDGPASAGFDDRAWRKIDLPHDWAVEQDFSGEASHSHGYKTVGWKYPERSLGWYRKSFYIPASDLGKKISIQFDGVFRNSTVWVNGFYLGHEQSGYTGFEYDITDYLNYDGNNVVAVRVDASIEEGWFYEGAGIYRHVWLNKTFPLHVDKYGVFATSEINGINAVVTIRANIKNDAKSANNFRIEHNLLDPSGIIVNTAKIDGLSLKAMLSGEYYSKIPVYNAKLWSVDEPNLYKIKTRLYSGEKLVDEYETSTGFRSIRFDAKEGFFLNGKHLKIVGSNNHQNHAGVGAAIPDALQYYRIKRLKEMGGNAYRTSHYPPTPEILDACDRLGMLVLVEARLMGVNQEHFDLLKRLIMRDRNHPCVISWSIGNEEWAIESNIKGARITETVQAYAKTLDSTRMFTVAVSGGCGYGSSQTVELMGFNYLAQCDIDEYHKKFPDQPKWGTEETTGCGTRGFYDNNFAVGHMAQFDRVGGVSIERGWKFYDERPWLAGLFYWTGFDYKGEPNPMSWPAVSSQFGIIDACGFPKDSYYYLKSWWGKDPVLHILPHWNWIGKNDSIIDVWVYSNAEEVELFLNKKSLGRKTMTKNGHLEWKVAYRPGTLYAKGYKNGKEFVKNQVVTSEKASSIELSSYEKSFKADGEDIVVVTVSIKDNKGNFVPGANNEISFEIEGPAKIIGVGNGDPGSHEPDKYFETVTSVKIENLQELVLDNLNEWPAIIMNATENSWKPAFKNNRNEDWTKYIDTLIAVRGTFDLSEITDGMAYNLFSKSIVEGQTIYVNGKQIASNIKRDDPNQSFKLDASILKKGKNEYVVVGQRFRKKYQWDNPNTDPGVVQTVVPSATWKRKAFNGLAQIIIQSKKEPGEIVLRASGYGLKPASLNLTAVPTEIRRSVE